MNLTQEVLRLEMIVNVDGEDRAHLRKQVECEGLRKLRFCIVSGVPLRAAFVGKVGIHGSKNPHHIPAILATDFWFAVLENRAQRFVHEDLENDEGRPEDHHDEEQGEIG